VKRRLFVPLGDWWRRTGARAPAEAQPRAEVAPECHCTTPPLHYSDYVSRPIGVDETNGRFGDVSIETCRHCGRLWLKYAVSYEAFSRSDRWYRGVVDESVAAQVTPTEAPAVLEALPWYLYGGSYFDSTGRRGSGTVNVDLL